MNYHPRIIEFFKKHNMYDPVMFEYLQENSMMIDYRDPDQQDFVGCFYKLNKNDILTNVYLNLPYVYDEKTMLISIHEITHGIENYLKIGKRFKEDITLEALPLLYEKLYIMENPSDELAEYASYLDAKITKSCQQEYQFGLKIREELIKNYHYDMRKMSKLVKKLARKYPNKRH